MNNDNEQYTAREIEIANEIATTLNDMEAFPLYLQYARRYTEAFLRSRLNRVMQIEERKIRTTRGALFTFLVSKAPDDART